MKAILSLLAVLITFYFFFNKESPPEETKYVEEFFEEEDEEAEAPKVVEAPSPQPKPTPKKTKPSPIVKAPLQPIATPIMPPTIPQAQGSRLAKYKSKTAPKNIEFKVTKDGKAIAHGDIFLGLVGKGMGKLQIGETNAKDIKLWDSDIPYFIEKDVKNKQAVENVINFYNANTNLNFYPGDAGTENSIVFSKGEEHCYSYLGKVGGHQPIFLSDLCQEREISHEIMHALGFIHEHTRTDRDEFVEILWDNIKEDFYSQFAMVPEVFMKPIIGFPFNYKSVMVYDPRSFAKKTSLTTLKSTTNEKISPTTSILSDQDIQRINRIY